MNTKADRVVIVGALALVALAFAARANAGEDDEVLFSPPVTGQLDGRANIHGVQTDESYPPPSLDPEDWEILNDGDPIVHHSQTIGKRRIDPVGFYLTADNLALFYNSGWDDYTRWFEVGGSRTQAGSLMAFDADWLPQDYHNNPVLDEPQTAWQGENRTMPMALWYDEQRERFYVLYGDQAESWHSNYRGGRALGIASSKDLVNFTYHSTEEPLFDVDDIIDIAPNVSYETGRVYASGAIYLDGYGYAMIRAEGKHNLILRSENPETTEGWEFVAEIPHSPMPIHYKGKWYIPRNIRDPHDDDMRAIGIVVGESLEDMTSEPRYVFSTGFASSGGSRQLFMYGGTWHIAWRQSNDENYRDMYVARQK